MRTDLPIRTPYRLGGLAPPDLPPCVPPSLITVGCGTGLFTRCPSPGPLGAGLGPPHPQLISMAAEPSGIRWERFSLSSRYSCRHSLSTPLQVAFPLPFSAEPDAPLPFRFEIRSVGADLSPGGLSAPRHHRPVSYYALFQGWLLLSQPPGCLRAATTLPTESGLRDLSRRSGLFPSRPRNLAPVVSLPQHYATAFVVWFGLVSGKPPHRSVYATSLVTAARRRYLNTFRGEPAISQFAWHFTPTHRSSLRFAIQMGSGLHARVPHASPCPWVDH